MQQNQHFHRIFDSGGYIFHVTGDNYYDVYVYGIRVSFDTAPTKNAPLKIVYDSEVQKDRNQCFLSTDMKGIKEITCMFDAPIELREYEYLKIDCPTTEGIVKRVDLLHQLRRD